MEYKTAEGHDIERDGEYEARNGKRVRVLGFVTNFRNNPIVGCANEADIGQWSAKGLLRNNPIVGCANEADIGQWSAKGLHWRLSDLDLMRPWSEKPDDESSWIKWKGGECPVSDEEDVEVFFRNGEIHNTIDYEGKTSEACDWSHKYIANDIVYYRIKESKPMEKYYKNCLKEVQKGFKESLDILPEGHELKVLYKVTVTTIDNMLKGEYELENTVE
jgi:hypothetical protein